MNYLLEIARSDTGEVEGVGWRRDEKAREEKEKERGDVAQVLHLERRAGRETRRDDGYRRPRRKQER